MTEENIGANPEDPPLTFSPFGARKTAPQFTQLSVDPSQGLTRKRYAWFSNGSLFDDTLVSEVEAGIRLATTATGTDEARIRSAYPGQYISQSYAQPGLGLAVDAENVVEDAAGHTSLTHGDIYAGAFYWDDATDEPETGLGFHWDSTGWEFFVKSLGVHLGPSPIPQPEWGIDSLDGDGWSGYGARPDRGYVYNFPHTWYNEGPLSAAWLNPQNNQMEELVRLAVNGRPSTDTPNLPVQLVVRNSGTADQLAVQLGGMQYSTYGAGREDLERRLTPETRVEDGYITTQAQYSENAVDPASAAGDPLVAARRVSGSEDLNLRTTEINIQPTPEDIWIFSWDEYEPDAALSGGGGFTPPVSTNNDDKETKILTNTTATDYTPQTAVKRGTYYFDGGQGQKISPTLASADLRVPLTAARVYTAVLATGNSAGTNPLSVTFEEGY